jgi:hypothetical protein
VAFFFSAGKMQIVDAFNGETLQIIDLEIELSERL